MSNSWIRRVKLSSQENNRFARLMASKNSASFRKMRSKEIVGRGNGAPLLCDRFLLHQLAVRGKWEEVISRSMEALSQKPDSRIDQLYLAIAYKKIGRPDLAKSYFKLAFSWDGEKDTDYIEMILTGHNFSKRGSFDIANLFYESVERSGCQDPEKLIKSALAFKKIEEYSRALRSFEKARFYAPYNNHICGRVYVEIMHIHFVLETIPFVPMNYSYDPSEPQE